MMGLFIGSFNPPTKAHLEIGIKLSSELEKIIFIPVNSKEKGLISINTRIEMLSTYTKKYSFFMIDDIMKNYSYLNYRILDILKNKYHNVTIIMGSDLLKKLNTFDNYMYLLNNYTFIVVERDNDDALKIIKQNYLNYQDKFKIINYQSNISSTLVRKLLKDNKDLKNVLDKDVLDYINEHHLY